MQHLGRKRTRGACEPISSSMSENKNNRTMKQQRKPQSAQFGTIPEGSRTIEPDAWQLKLAVASKQKQGACPQHDNSHDHGQNQMHGNSMAVASKLKQSACQQPNNSHEHGQPTLNICACPQTFQSKASQTCLCPDHKSFLWLARALHSSGGVPGAKSGTKSLASDTMAATQ